MQIILDIPMHQLINQCPMAQPQSDSEQADNIIDQMLMPQDSMTQSIRSNEQREINFNNQDNQHINRDELTEQQLRSLDAQRTQIIVHRHLGLISPDNQKEICQFNVGDNQLEQQDEQKKENGEALLEEKKSPLMHIIRIQEKPMLLKNQSFLRLLKTRHPHPISIEQVPEKQPSIHSHESQDELFPAKFTPSQTINYSNPIRSGNMFRDQFIKYNRYRILSHKSILSDDSDDQPNQFQNKRKIIADKKHKNCLKSQCQVCKKSNKFRSIDSGCKEDIKGLRKRDKKQSSSEEDDESFMREPYKTQINKSLH